MADEPMLQRPLPGSGKPKPEPAQPARFANSAETTLLRDIATHVGEKLDFQVNLAHEMFRLADAPGLKPLLHMALANKLLRELANGVACEEAMTQRRKPQEREAFTEQSQVFAGLLAVAGVARAHELYRKLYGETFPANQTCPPPEAR